MKLEHNYRPILQFIRDEAAKRGLEFEVDVLPYDQETQDPRDFIDPNHKSTDQQLGQLVSDLEDRGMIATPESYEGISPLAEAEGIISHQQRPKGQEEVIFYNTVSRKITGPGGYLDVVQRTDITQNVGSARVVDPTESLPSLEDMFTMDSTLSIIFARDEMSDFEVFATVEPSGRLSADQEAYDGLPYQPVVTELLDKVMMPPMAK